MSDDIDAEQLIARLCGPLAPADRVAFRAAAEGALNAVVCAGEGIAYRTVREVWRAYFHPPDIRVTSNNSPRKSTKLIAAPAIGKPDQRSERRLKVVR
jgi:hypothetical protein